MMDDVPKKLYNELFEKYEQLVRENERLKMPIINQPYISTPTLPWYGSEPGKWTCLGKLGGEE